MNCLIVDDNKMARVTLNQLATQIEDLEIIGEFSSGMEVYNFLKARQVDIIFLDIEMPQMSGIELIKSLQGNSPIIIFTTSKKDYAVEAFELNVADFLVKPVSPARFIQAVDKARTLIESKKDEVNSNDEEFIFIRDSNIIRRLKIDDILFAEAMGDYVKIHTPQKLFAIHNTLKSVEHRLSSKRFIRVHRSFIVALSKIDSVQDGIILIKDKHIPVADAYRSLLSRQLDIL